MMNWKTYLLAVATCAIQCGCHTEASKMFTFFGHADGYGQFYLRRLTIDRDASVQLQINFGKMQEKYPSFTNRMVWHEFEIAENTNAVSLWIEVYESPMDEWHWDHFRRPLPEMTRSRATSGHLRFRLGPPEEQPGWGYSGTFIVSNASFSGEMPMTIPNIQFEALRVGWEGID